MTEPEKITLPSHVEMKTIDSSHHSRAGYDQAAGHLYIDFSKDEAAPNIYRYSNVTPDDFSAYSGSESKGKHFISTFKKNADKFPYAKVSA